MIVREQENAFIMIKQHDHARISGEIVSNWKNNFLLRSKLREEADWAVFEHDRAWIPLDDHPVWDGENNRPYSFIDYPLEKKLAAYQRGIEEVAAHSLYAGMLCSMHYQSFFSEEADDIRIRQFIKEEKERQETLFAQMETDVPMDIYQLHFKRLQFCDDLSLYVCMQEPGITKSEEVPWFKDGFRQSFDFSPEGMMAHWKDENHVTVDPFPFQSAFDVLIPYRLVQKDLINDVGIERAYQETEVKHYRISFIPES
ncbi:DUF3891 family protein [Halobacillus yeomjeoni]|uniref:DUF3891 family protein n=1 Tax=Halobacillus yeomjeoni TaxID=311194 RepID=A0A931HVB7_9BACI|nr:DUF3891 family protein [Halobacillus yeomjeoni]MBH0230214.1 DUF3891 family protein [Halobacillus yeomjeoni]